MPQKVGMQACFRVGVILAALALLGLFALCVWPTLYVYDHFHWKDNSRPVRTNRLTGRAEMLDVDGWHVMEKRRGEPVKPKAPIPPPGGTDKPADKPG